MIEVVFDDLLRQDDLDAIVNPANKHMLHGGGLAQIIVASAGREVALETQQVVSQQGMVPTGEAILSSPGQLPFKAIIHVVGPVWEEESSAPYWRKNSGDENPDELLKRAHINALRLAHEHDLASVGFPAVSCGVFRFPVERAAPLAVAAVREAQIQFPVSVRFCLLDDNHYDCFRQAVEEGKDDG